MIPSGHGGSWLSVNPSFGCELGTRAFEAPLSTFGRSVELDQGSLLTMQFGAFAGGVLTVDVEGFSGVGTGNGTASKRWDRNGDLMGRTFTLEGKVDG